MSDIYYKRNECRLCGSTELHLVMPFAQTPLADSYIPESLLTSKQNIYPLDMYLCNNCGHVQLLDVIRAEAIYYDYLYKTQSSLGLVEHFREYSDYVLDKINPKEGSLIVDLGSNDGTLLGFYKNRGYRVLGFDPAKTIAEKACSMGIETVSDFFNSDNSKKYRKTHGAASIISTNNIFANIDDADDFMQGIHNLLDEDGVYILECAYLLDLVKNMVFDFIYHEHLSQYSIKPLVKFFEKHGMELFDVMRVPTKGGSIRCFVQLINGPRPKSKNLNKFLLEEESAGLYQVSFYEDFMAKVDKAKNEVRNKLIEYRKSGSKIAAYGASATSTTLLYHFELSNFIDFFVDENPVKIGLYSPGVHIPVYEPDKLCSLKPDVVIIMAWRYADAIIQKNTKLQRNSQW